VNESAEEHETAGAALDVDAQAAEFLIRRADRTHWSADDEAGLEVWLSQSLAHKAAYWRLESIWERADRLNALRPLLVQGTRVTPAPRRRSLLFGIAAAIVAAVAIGANFAMLRAGATTYSTPIGGREIIRLSDGSRIELNTDTVLRTRFSGGKRNVELVKGEAFFQIKHDAAHPFVVLAANHRVTDLGTKFLVREDGGRLKVVLLEGSARLTSANARNTAGAAILTPGDVAVATARDLSIARKSMEELKSGLSWQRGVLVFHHATLLEVATEYNRYNRQKIVIADTAAGARVINATLPATDVGAFARMAQNFLGLNIEYRDDAVVIR